MVYNGDAVPVSLTYNVLMISTTRANVKNIENIKLALLITKPLVFLSAVNNKIIAIIPIYQYRGFGRSLFNLTVPGAINE